MDGEMNFFRRLLLNHPHILRLEDMAIGISDGKPGVPVTGWRWKCAICGKIIEEYTDSGMKLIARGHPKEVVFHWFSDKQKEIE
jgi:hypothetical protein